MTAATPSRRSGTSRWRHTAPTPRATTHLTATAAQPPGRTTTSRRGRTAPTPRLTATAARRPGRTTASPRTLAGRINLSSPPTHLGTASAPRPPYRKPRLTVTETATRRCGNGDSLSWEWRLGRPESPTRAVEIADSAGWDVRLTGGGG